MLIFNCTKAAAEFLTVTRKGVKQSPIQKPPENAIDDSGTPELPISPWLVHAVKVQRKHVLIAMHVNTRYAMVFCDLKKGETSSFLGLLVERLFNNMQFFGEEFEMCDEESFHQMLQVFLGFHSSPYFCQRGDRSVQSHINDVAWQFEDRVYEVGSLPNNHEQAGSFDEWMNSLLRKTKQHRDYFYPDEEMFLEWISHYGGLPSSEHDLVRECFASLRRQSFSDVHETTQEIEQVVNGLAQHAAMPLVLSDNVIDFVKAKQNKE